VVTVVVPYRGATAKSRLGRPQLAQAMLEDVVAAARAVGDVVVANGDGGQAAAVASALADVVGPAMIVNADVPCVTPEDLRTLLRATPDGGTAIVAAEDGTTNAVSLTRADQFEPLYGPGSAERFRGRGAIVVDLPNLVADVDTWDDLLAVRDRVGTRTRAALDP
jgi:2-phospho-L-lactate guanylyltransferase (CobY/MobA/RfbA family)